MKDLYDEAIGYLKGYFTTSFLIWLNLPDNWIPKEFVYAHRVIGVVNLARLTGELSLLPLALLVCSQLRESHSKGFRYSD